MTSKEVLEGIKVLTGVLNANQGVFGNPKVRYEVNMKIIELINKL